MCPNCGNRPKRCAEIEIGSPATVAMRLGAFSTGGIIDDNGSSPESDDAEAVALAVRVQYQQLEAALEQLPPNRRRAIVQVVEAQLSHSGPLPSQSSCGSMKKSCPDLPNVLCASPKRSKSTVTRS